jgi:hypothetical protein
MRSPDIIPCPVLKILYPTYVVPAQGSLTLSAEVLGSEKVTFRGQEITIYEKKNLSFAWQVSAGKIIRGQGSSQIIVDLDSINTDDITHITGSVEAKGFSPECQNKEAFSLTLDPKCNAPQKFDEYEDIPFTEEKEHLDNLGTSFTGSGVETVAYIVAYAGRRSCDKEAEWRLNRAKEYLVGKYNILEERIIIVDGGYRENFAVHLFLSRRRNCGVIPSPNVAPIEVYDIGDCSMKYRKRGELDEP